MGHPIGEAQCCTGLLPYASLRGPGVPVILKARSLCFADTP